MVPGVCVALHNTAVMVAEQVVTVVKDTAWLIFEDDGLPIKVEVGELGNARLEGSLDMARLNLDFCAYAVSVIRMPCHDKRGWCRPAVSRLGSEGGSGSPGFEQDGLPLCILDALVLPYLAPAADLGVW